MINFIALKNFFLLLYFLFIVTTILKQFDMKHKIIIGYLLVAFFTLCLTSCQKDEFASVSTFEPTGITDSSAVFNGHINQSGNPGYSEKGMCYSEGEYPLVSDIKIIVPGRDGGPYSATAYGLKPNTTYYVRAYATNRMGTTYGRQFPFTTAGEALPEIVTLPATDITDWSVILCGNIEHVGYPAYSERGFCYATNTEPELSDSVKVVSGDGTGEFTVFVTDLEPNTTYYVRAYATNTVGTAYGDEITFTTTNSGIPVSYVRFEKEDNYMYCTIMNIVENGGQERVLALHEFGVNDGISRYFTIHEGSHAPTFYYSEPEMEGWYFCLEEDLLTYEFKAQHQYTVVCSSDEEYLIFYVREEEPYPTKGASIKKSDIKKKTYSKSALNVRKNASLKAAKLN